ncbi:MAG: hypothetical protein KIT34_03585 [Cyanobacteria bacterium TGS_CYA1]|nr:hypothetical protein [Cyanobacteria bacterium TGS_CYA1]
MTKLVEKIFFLAFCVIFLASCSERERGVIWSPNGERAMVNGSDGLRICDEKGNISPVVSKNAKLIAWTPDSRQCYICRSESETDWKNVKAMLTPAQIEICRKNAEKVFAYLMEYKDDLDGFGAKVDADKEIDRHWVAESILYLKDVHGPELNEKVYLWRTLKLPNATFNLIERYDYLNNSLKNPFVIRKTYDGVTDLSASPNGKALAVVESREGNKLYVVSIDGKKTLLVSSDCSEYPAWSFDGDSIFYFEGEKQKDCEFRSGTLCKTTVISKTGKILDDNERSKKLLTSIFQASDRVEPLPDDSVIFTSRKFSFPNKSSEENSKIFFAKSDSEEIVQLTEDNLEGLDWFRLSPDGKILLLYDSSGQVAIMNLQDRKLETLLSKERSPGEFKFSPSWRSESEICLAVRSTNEIRGENDAMAALMNISDKTVRTLSQKWPTSCTEEFLIGKAKGKNRLQEKIDKYTNR